MRVRMIRPAYWTDADLHTRLTAEQREFYIGLWMLSDDAGYVEWDPVRIGADLYPYRGLAWRTRRITEWVGVLREHVVMLPCGKHLVVPNLEKHQNVPRPSYPNKRAHEAKCGHMRSPAGREGNLREGKDRESESGASPRTQCKEETNGLVARIGPFEAIVGGKA